MKTENSQDKAKRKKDIKEERLITALRNRDPRGIEEIYRAYAINIHGILMKILKDAELSNDALQEVVLKIWSSFHNYDASKGRLFTWILNLARNYAIDRLRSRQLKNSGKNASLDDCFHEAEHFHQVQHNIDTIGLRKLVAGLKPEWREAIEAVYFKGYTQAQAAELLKLPLGTLKTRIKYATIALRKNYMYERSGEGR